MYAVNKDAVVFKEQSGAEQREALSRQPEETRQPYDYYFFTIHISSILSLNISI